MGTLADFDLRHLIADFSCAHLLVLGIADGRSLAEALRHDFTRILAVEPAHPIALEAALRHASEPRLTVIHEPVERGLERALGELPKQSPALFWLDLPPLERQLRTIAAGRDIGRDILIIDDLNLHEDGDYEEEPADDAKRPRDRGRKSGLIDGFLAGSHELQRFRRRGGYLMALPAGGGK